MRPRPPDESGSFEQISFALLLIRALDKRWSGTLTIAPAEGMEHVIQLDRGLVCRVLVPDAHARLGDIVIEAGVIMESELERALAEEGLLGHALTEAHLIDAKTLQRALVLQLLKRLVRVFGFCVETRWAFSADTSAFAGMPEGVRIDTLRVLWAGLSAQGETGSWITTTLRRIGESPFQVRGDVNLLRFGFTGDARNLVRVIRDQRCNLRELSEREIAPEQVTHTVVYVLAITRHLDFAPAGTSQTLNGVEIDDDPSTDSYSRAHDAEPPSSDEATSNFGDDGAAGSGSSQDVPTKSKPRRVARIKLRRVAKGRSESPSERERPPAPSSSTGASAGPDASAGPGSAEERSGPEAGARQAEHGGLPTQLSDGVPDQLMADVRSRLERLERETPFALLGLDPDELGELSDDQVTEKAWAALEEASARWDPDNCPHELAELREGMARIHDAMAAAFEAIVEPDEGAEPVDGREENQALPTMPAPAHPGSNNPPSDKPPSGERPSRRLTPSQLHERALMAFAEQRYHEALRLCRRATEERPEQPEYLASSAWIRSHLDDPDVPLLLLDLDDIVRNHPGYLTARYYRGVLRRRAGELERAREDLLRVLAEDSRHEGARHQLELIEQASSMSV